MLNIGLLGAGRIGQVHAVNIASHKGSRLAAVSDVYAPAAETLAKQYGADVRTIEETLGDTAIDAVLVATSTDTHAELVEAATAAGKAVFCEKPVDLSLERARACQEKAEATGQPVMVGFNRRFDPNFGALKQALRNGEIGKAEMLAITSFDPAPPPIEYVKVSGGLFRDMMIHDFDMATFLMDDMPETVTAIGSSLVDPAIGEAGDVDTAAVTLAYADGRIAVVRNSRRAAYGYDQRVEVLGSKGMLQAENIRENSVITSTVAGVTYAKPKHFFLERYMPAFAAEWSSFVEAVSNKTPLPVTLADGIRSLVLAEAATRSKQTGAPVRVSDL